MSSLNAIELLCRQLELELNEAVARELERRLVKQFRDNTRSEIRDVTAKLVYNVCAYRDWRLLRDEIRVFVEGLDAEENGEE